MKVILTEKIEGLGNRGEIKEVRSGYARNFLLPQKKALLPNDAQVTTIIKELDKQKEKKDTQKNQLESILDKVSAKTCTFSAKTDKTGKLYGSIGPKEIAEKTGIPQKYLHQHYKKLGVNDTGLEIDGRKVNFKIEIIKQK